MILNRLSSIGLLKSDSQEEIAKKVALTLLPFYIVLPAFIWSLIYLYLDNLIAFSIPALYVTISILSMFYLYKTKKFKHFETVQLFLILFLPFLLMWILGGFSSGSFVFIWAFYAPVASAVYSESIKVETRWFIMFLFLLFISMLIDSTLTQSIEKTFPIYILEIFTFLNIGAALGGIYFLISKFINNIKVISIELKRDRESLFNLTQNLKNTNRELEYLATSDIVTELPNRLYFINMVSQLLQNTKVSNKKVAIMFLDLDGFKVINDTHGHEAGDIILKTMGSRLKSLIRESDIVARIGGDEFAIALGKISNISHVEFIAKTIIKEINEHCPYKDILCQVGVSIGISLYPDHGDTIDELLKKADESMYKIKKEGKNNYFIYRESL